MIRSPSFPWRSGPLFAGLVVGLAMHSPNADAAGFTEIETGVKYAAGQRIGSARTGASFLVPNGWVAQLPPGGQAVMIGSATVPGIVMVMVDRSDGPQAVANGLAKPQELQQGVTVKPRGAPEIDGNHVRIHYEGESQGRGVAGEAHAVAGDGVALAFVALGPEEQRDTYRGVVDELATSAQFEAPARPSAP